MHQGDVPTEAFHDMVDKLKTGDVRGAIGQAYKLATGSDSPFADAGKAVIQGVTKNALDIHNAIQKKDLSAIPVVGPAAANYAKDVQAGNTAGAIGSVVGGVSSVLPMLLGDEASAGKVGEVAGKVGDTLVPENLRNAVGDVAGKVKTATSEEAAANVAQPEVQQAVRNAAKTAEPTAVETPSVRSAVESAGDQVLAKSKAAYQVLDEATGGWFQRFTDQMKNLQMKMNEVAGIDDDAYEQYELKRNDIETVQNNLIEQLVDEGKIDPKLADQAKADFKQSMALYDLDNAVKASTKGVRPEQATAGSTAEYLDAGKLDTRLQKLNDSGRLAQAVGPDAATKLIQSVDEALRSRNTAVSKAKFVQKIVKAAPYVGGAITGLGVISHVLGGKKR